MKNKFMDPEKREKEIILCLLQTTSPVSIDTILALSGVPALTILNIMDKLIKKQLVYEKKQYPKGTYFLNNVNLALYLKKFVREEQSSSSLLKFIELYDQTLEEGEEKTLLLAELYWKLSDGSNGLAYIKQAADILLFQLKQAEKALAYYDYVLQYFVSNTLTKDNAQYFIDSVLRKYVITRHLMTTHEQISLLLKAHQTATRYKLLDSLVKIKLPLSQLFQWTAQHKKAFRYVHDGWELSKKIGNQELTKAAAVFMCEFFLAHGRVSKAISFYEDSVGNLEKFDNNPLTLQAVANLALGYVINGKIARGMGIIKAVRARADILEFASVAISSELAAALSLIEVGKWTEVGSHLDKIFSFPESVTGPFVLAIAWRCRAYVCMKKEDYQAADEYLTKSIMYAARAEWRHPKGSWWWLFELLDALERRNFFHEDMNYDDEVEKLLNWDDIHTKGVAYRCRAIRNVERQQHPSSIIADLESSEKYLKSAGAEIDLARTRIALGEAYWKKGDAKHAHLCLGKAWTFLSRVGKNLFPRHLLAIIPQDQRIAFVIGEIVNINESLGAIKDRSLFLEQVINMALDFCMAIRGAFFIALPGCGPTIAASRNLDPVSKTKDEFELINKVVAQVAIDDVEIIIPGEERNDLNLKSSLTNIGIMSLICAPARLHDHTYGYLYLDNHVNGGPFSRDVLPYMKLICSQIALGLSKIEEYDRIMGLKDHYQQEAIFYKKEMGVAAPTGTIIGKSEEMRKVMAQIQQVAPTDSSVLIMGETGVGKELVAKALHNLSKRKDGPFIPVNLSSLPTELLASELFGHEKGSFTGANEQTKGRFELANRGTVFLDEVGDLPPGVQVKLLRVLQEGMFERIGGQKSILSDFRVIAATNKDLLAEVKKGTFRSDLYYRLNVFPIYIPPLRDRQEDILPLAHYFLSKFSKAMGKRIKQIPGGEVRRLTAYHWPGNVRELEHLIERAVILSEEKNISFSGFEYASSDTNSYRYSTSMSLIDVEREHIVSVLNTVGWKVSGPQGAATILGLRRSTLRAKMNKMAIKRPSVVMPK